MSQPQIDRADEVLLDLGPPGTGPLHERVERALRDGILSGRFAEGTALPPSRRLAADLGCSRWAVTEAYGQLVAEGYLQARSGAATRVRWSRGAGPPDRPRPGPGAPAIRFDLAPGLPDLRHFPRRRWADAVRAEAVAAPDAEFGHPPPHGHPRLRGLLAGYLERSRGARADADLVTMCTSVTDGVRRLCRVLREQGFTAVACEEPGWTRLSRVVRSAGLATVAVRTDAHGLRVDDLAAHPQVRAVIVTAAHQFPGGTVLAPQRRAGLLRWARDVDGLIIEDDYDAEFRYDRRPVGTVQGMDPSRVILLKSLSKMLSPALGIGWIVAPRRWTEALRHGDPPSTPPVLDQLAFASLLRSGCYDRHLRACRQRYRARRDLLVGELAGRLPGLAVSGAAAGLHLVLHLPNHVDTAAVVASAEGAGVRLADLASCHAGAGDADNGLVLGYGNLADSAVPQAVQLLAAALEPFR
jgi:GntR family transcriptional regulator/MocR family aminotransferase